VLRKQGTERPFKMTATIKGTLFFVRPVSLLLFSSEVKFSPGTGWPSFYAPLNENIRVKGSCG
jgi:peptide-methionine (R)-S-oxide reductase